MRFKAFRIRLHPNNKQETMMSRYAGAARYVYNWTLDQFYKNHIYDEHAIRKAFTQYKKLPGNEWLNDISNDVLKQSIRDACAAWDRHKKGLADKPRYKSRDKSQPSFYQDTCKIKFTEDRVRIQKLSKSKRKSRDVVNWVKLAERNRVPLDAKYYNPRFTFDGEYWYLSIAIEVSDEPGLSNKPKSDGIGIDLGVKSLAIVSDGTSYPNLNKTDYLKKLEKRKKRLQRSIFRKYTANNPGLAKAGNNFKKGKRYRRSRNTEKAIKKFKRASNRITNIMHAYLLDVVRTILSKNPEYVALEDLNVKGMLKNHKIAKSLAGQRFGLFRDLMEREATKHGIEIGFVNRWYPSSKTCSRCGHVKHDLTLADRTYVCPQCGLTIDRDLNAAINIREEYARNRKEAA